MEVELYHLSRAYLFNKNVCCYAQCCAIEWEKSVTKIIDLNTWKRSIQPLSMIRLNYCAIEPMFLLVIWRKWQMNVANDGRIRESLPGATITWPCCSIEWYFNVPCIIQTLLLSLIIWRILFNISRYGFFFILVNHYKACFIIHMCRLGSY